MLRIVTYHRVAEPDENPLLDPALISATPAAFEAQMKHLRRFYDVVAIKDVLDAVQCGCPLPPRPVMITFDDAYTDFAAHAWPILKQHGLPATVFVPTAYASDSNLGFWWDRMYRAVSHLDQPALSVIGLGELPVRTPDQRRIALKRLRRHVKALPRREAAAFIDELVSRSPEAGLPVPSVLAWHRLRQLQAEGVTLAPHSRTHTILTHLSPDEVHEEVAGSRQDLLRETGSDLRAFCYPNGNVDDRVVEVLRNAGYLLGFTTSLGHNSLAGSSLFRLCRTDITLRTSLAVFKMRLLSLGNYIDRWRDR